MKPLFHSQPRDGRVLNTPLGTMLVRLDEKGNLAEATFSTADPSPAGAPLPPAMAQLLAQLDEFAHGSRGTFDLPLADQGTAFERSVWALARMIPKGARTTYGELAQRLGKPDAARAVGGALGRNPWHVVIPCHRVVGRSGSLTGYAAGVDIKRRLLELESAHRVEPGLTEPSTR